MTKVAILVDNYVEEVEFQYPYYRFKEENFEVTVISPKSKIITGKNGVQFKPDRTIKPEDADYFDLVFVPGGYAPDHLRRDKNIVEFVKKMYDKHKIVAAICHGPWLLASAGILKNKKITSFYSIKDDLIHAGAQYTGNKIEQDDNIITATDPSALPAFLKLIITKIKSTTKH